MITIRTVHSNGKPMIGLGTKIIDDTGAEVPGVTRCTLFIEPETILHAELDIMVGEVDVEAHPLLSLETLTEAADHYGYRLVPMEDDE